MSNIYIYKITNKSSKEVYIGIRETENDIYQERYKGENTVLAKELKKLGKKSFLTEVIAKDLSRSMAELFLLEYKRHLKATILEELDDKEFKKIHQKGKRSGGKRKVICLNNKRDFDSGAEASRAYGLKETSVPKACQSHGVKTAGIDPETGEELKWMYYDEYIAREEGREYIPPVNYRASRSTRRVLCETTGEDFDSIREASEFYKVSEGAISSCCSSSGTKTAGVDPETGEKLTWIYLD